MSAVLYSTRRFCDYPDCTASYDAAAVLGGDERAEGWLQLPRHSLDMCGEHSRIWRGGWHTPRMASPTGGGACSCGVLLLLAPSTLGNITGAYLDHLGEAAP